MKDFKSVLLVLLSIVLVVTWIFHFYEKGQYQEAKEKKYIKDSASITSLIAEAVKDSVKKFNAEKNEAPDSLNRYVDSLRTQLNFSLTEIIRLKNEIDAILQNDQATQSDLSKSRNLIDELNNRIDKLKAENRLLLAQKNEGNRVQRNNVTILNEPTQTSQKTKGRKEDSIFVASEISLSAVTAKTESEDAWANTIKEPDKLVFSFTLRNNLLRDSYYDVYIVISGPGNKVLQTDQWAAAENFFVSKTEGTRAYTKRIHFEYNRGDQKRITAAIEPEKITAGIYTLKIYYNGVVIGQTSKPIG
jgi:hypothetical protein